MLLNSFAFGIDSNKNESAVKKLCSPRKRAVWPIDWAPFIRSRQIMVWFIETRIWILKRRNEMAKVLHWIISEYNHDQTNACAKWEYMRRQFIGLTKNQPTGQLKSFFCDWPNFRRGHAMFIMEIVLKPIYSANSVCEALFKMVISLSIWWND